MRLVDADGLVEELGLSCHGCNDNCIKRSCQIPEIIKRIENLLLSTDKEPNLFSCPVRPGQTVYIVEFAGIVKVEIESVTWNKDGSWTANWAWGSFGWHYGWGRNIFLTHEEAENAMETFEKGCAEHVQIARGIL